MAQPLIMSIPHQLGRAEARRRLEGGVVSLKRQFADKIGGVEESWTGDRLDFSIKALGQSVSGNLDVADDHVRVEVKLPFLLAMVGQQAKAYIEKEGTLLLAKK